MSIKPPAGALRACGLGLTIIGLLSAATAAPLVEDAFNYGTGNLTAVSGGTWTAHSSSGSGPVPVTAGTLSYAGLKTSEGNQVELSGSRAEDVSLAFTPVTGTGNAVYVSFLLNVAEARANTGASGGNPEYFAHFREGDSTSRYFGRLGIRVDSGDDTKYRIGTGLINGSSQSSENSTFAATLLNENQTYLIVQKYTFISGNMNDQVALWINPASLGGSEPLAAVTVTNSPANTGSNPNDADPLIGLKHFSLRQASNIGDMAIDEVRVGTSWADVTPPFVVQGDDPNAQLLSSLGFPDTPNDASAEATLTITNSGVAQNLNITNAAITGDDAEHFEIISGVPATGIAPAASANIVLRYKPEGQAGLTQAVLSLSTNDPGDPTIDVGLSGLGVSVLPFLESFDYPAGGLVLVGDSNWNSFASANQVRPEVLTSPSDTGASLSYPGMPSSVGNRLKLAGGTNREDDRRLFADEIGNTDGAIYVSMLIKVDNVPTTTTNNDKFFAFAKRRTTGALVDNGAIRIRQSPNNAAKYQLGTALTTFAMADVTWTGDLDAGVTYLAVLRYELNTTEAANRTTLWVNPTPSGTTDGLGARYTASHPHVSGELTVGTDEYLVGINLYQDQYAGAYQLQLDELRVASSYAGVMSNQPPPNAARHWMVLD